MAEDEEFESEKKFHNAVERQFKRRSADQLPVRIEVQGKEHEGTLEDISGGGIRIKSEAKIPARGKITVHVPFKGKENQEMHLTGVIRWSKQVSEAGVELTSKSRDLS